ncbi:hypothetical protein KM043_003117 [Ampulex compressa]|nr:hypothetical protein KM043_003117 [Ampulex compressa]
MFLLVPAPRRPSVAPSKVRPPGKVPRGRRVARRRGESVGRGAGPEGREGEEVDSGAGSGKSKDRPWRGEIGEGQRSVRGKAEGRGGEERRHGRHHYQRVHEDDHGRDAADAGKEEEEEEEEDKGDVADDNGERLLTKIEVVVMTGIARDEALRGYALSSTVATLGKRIPKMGREMGARPKSARAIEEA